jgi:hypothetical protein
VHSEGGGEVRLEPLTNFNGKCPYAEGKGVLGEKPAAFIRRTVADGSKRCLSGN